MKNRFILLLILFLGFSSREAYSQSILDSDGSELFHLPFDNDTTFTIKTLNGVVFVNSTNSFTYFSSSDSLNKLQSVTIQTKKQIVTNNYDSKGQAVSIELRQLGLFHKNWLFLLDGNGALREINIYKRKKRESFVF